MQTVQEPTARHDQAIVRLRFASDGPLCSMERAAAELIRPMLAARGFDADDYDIAAAYAEWSEDTYAASWMPLDFFSEKSVDGLLQYLTPAI